MTATEDIDTGEAPAWVWALKAGITAFALTVLWLVLPFDEIWRDMRNVPPFVWIGVFAAFLIGHVAAALKWRMLVAPDAPAGTLVRAHFAGLAANIALPGIVGGDVARSALAAPHAKSMTTLVTGSVLDRLIDLGVLLLICAAGALLIGLETTGQAWIAVVAFALIIAGLLAICFLGPLARFVAGLTFSGPLGRIIGLLSGALNAAAERRRALIACIGLSLLIQMGFVALNVALSASMGGPTSFAMWMFAWPLAKLIAVLPISLGGLGVREASLASVFASLGVAGATVVAVGFVWQTILIAAGLTGLAMQWFGTKVPKPAADPINRS